MKAYLTRRVLFSASHRLNSDLLSEAENKLVYGKCNNPHGHGHNYFLEITVGGQIEETTGMVCNLSDIDQFIEREILQRFAETNLNTLDLFSDSVPTTENLCLKIFDIIQTGFTAAKVYEVRIEETMLNSFTVTADGWDHWQGKRGQP